MSAIRMWIALAWIVGVAAAASAQEGPQYVGADGCKACHQDIYDVWANTKHAKTFNRLSASDKKTDCVRCHVTGTAEQIVAEADVPKFPGAQCESCHGPGSLHAADPTVMTGISKKPSEAACTRCHNDKSPHYRGFMYSAMLGFSHPVKK
jgi:hypothetical protein